MNIQINPPSNSSATLNTQATLKTDKIRLIFMGTPDFACPGLKAVLDMPELEIVGVITQADKPVGRKQVVLPSAVKTLALKHNLNVFQPLKAKDIAPIISQLQADLCLVIAYGKIIPPAALSLAPKGFLNVHASLLPKYRGAACLSAPILNGDKETGVTIMQIDSGLDTGPILRQAKMKLNGHETLKDVHDHLANLGASLLPETIKDWLAGRIKVQAQDNNQASYVSTLKKEDGKIDWKKSALEIDRMIRAFNPWPGTFSQIADKNELRLLKILAVEHSEYPEKNRPAGELFLHENKLAVQCGQDILIILKLQLAGRLPMTAQEFLSGYSSLLGKIMT